MSSKIITWREWGGINAKAIFKLFKKSNGPTYKTPARPETICEVIKSAESEVTLPEYAS